MARPEPYDRDRNPTKVKPASWRQAPKNPRGTPEVRPSKGNDNRRADKRGR